MEKLFEQKILNANYLFDDYYLNAKSLYVQLYGGLPNVSFIGQVDGEKSFDALKEKLGKRIVGIFQYQCYHRKKKAFQFNATLLVLDSQCVVELDSSYCEILHNGQQPELIDEVTSIVTPLRVRQRREALIVLLHGLPGTGKTTYLRYLIGKIKKRVLFLSPSLAGNLMNPDFVELLVSNPETVVIIEDAERIIMDRKHSPDSSVSSLLNISDGLLADFLKIQLICTFNNSLTLVDSALLRKGRLIAKHEFGKLTIAESQRLSAHLGFDTTVNKPMTIAEIANQHEKNQSMTQPEAIGFRRQTIEN